MNDHMISLDLRQILRMHNNEAVKPKKKDIVAGVGKDSDPSKISEQ